MIYLELFWSFFQVGLFSIGGGYAAMPSRYREAIAAIREGDRKSTRLNSSHIEESRMPSSA